MPNIAAVVLAAGKGTRMKSELPKVLHQVCGMPMISHVLNTLAKVGAEKKVIVIGHGAEQVKKQLGEDFLYAYQEEQLGTGHAVLQAKSHLESYEGITLVVCGDTPLLSVEAINDLIAEHKKSSAAATILTAVLDNPTGYGRIIRNASGTVEKIVEQKDANPEELAVGEINSGTYCFDNQFLFSALKEIKADNAQGEYYLTDVIEIARNKGLTVSAYIAPDPDETIGVNSRKQLAEVGKLIQQKILDKLMENGVTIVDPSTTYIQLNVEIANDTIIHPFCFIEGNTKIGTGCEIGPSTRLIDCIVGNDTQIANSIAQEAKIGDRANIGPFSYLRPGTVLAADVKVGDFVEIKKSFIGNGSKVPHLSYIGDAQIGESVNIGAGTITCNYDGKNKHQTVIEDNVFVGSNTNLVAPVKVEKGSIIGAGSTITDNIPAFALGIAREKQKNINDWAKKKKK